MNNKKPAQSINLSFHIKILSSKLFQSIIQEQLGQLKFHKAISEFLRQFAPGWYLFFFSKQLNNFWDCAQISTKQYLILQHLQFFFTCDGCRAMLRCRLYDHHSSWKVFRMHSILVSHTMFCPDWLLPVVNKQLVQVWIDLNKLSALHVALKQSQNFWKSKIHSL